jgi:tetratricopeptide (TPR) repeat protein
VRRALAVISLAVSLSASAQYVPPVPKSIGGDRALNRTEIPLPSSQLWVRAKSPHFLTLSGAGPRRTAHVVGQLEIVAAALRQIDPIFAVQGEPTRLVLFARSRDAAPYFDLLLGNRTAGVYIVAPDGSGTMLVDGSRSFADRTLFHELVHNLLANGGVHLPMWLEEGLAEYFSTAEVNRGTVTFGQPIEDRMNALRGRALMPIDEVFAQKPGSEMAGSGFFYAQSWAIVDWMMRYDRRATLAFIHDVERGTSSSEAFRKHFDMDESGVQLNLNAPFVRPPAVFSINVPPPQELPAPQPLARDDVILELATFLASFEATRSDAQRFVNSIDKPDADAIAVTASILARDKRYDEAAKLYEQALRMDPKNGEIRLAFAESLLRDALGPFTGTSDIDPNDGPRFRRARELAAESLENGADPARAYAVLGTSYLAEENVKPGIEALQRAHLDNPARYDIALNLYALLLRNGQRVDAEELYRDISAQAKTPQAIFAAKAVVVREQLALANRLLAQTRVDEAIAVVQQLMAATPDTVAKGDLERQLGRLREVAEVNKQIGRYNDAVRAANTGQTKRAIAILDGLLAGATDPAVVSDATELRKTLEKRLAGMRKSRRRL